MTTPTIQQTILTMIAFHDGQIDKSGVPYFNHPLRVMLRLGPDVSDDARHAALLHDTMEDCGVTAEILRDLGYSEETINMVALVSRLDKSIDYRQFIFSILRSGNVEALMIKLADLYDNSSEVRREKLPPEIREDVERMIEGRYVPAIRQIREALGHYAEGVFVGDMEVEIDMKEVTGGN